MYHRSTLVSIFKSRAIVGKPTVTRPANRLLIPVMRTTDKSTMAVVPFETASCCSAETAFAGGLIGLVSSLKGGVSSPFRCTLEGCVSDSGICTNSIDVEERDMMCWWR